MKSVRTFDRRTPPEEMLRHRRAWKRSDTVFKVYGREGDEYIVEMLDDGRLTCTCAAGEKHQECWHVRRVARRLIRELARRAA